MAQTSYGAGATITSWDDIHRTVRAGIFPLRGSEKLEALKLEANVSHRIRIRYRSGILPKHRIALRQKSEWRYFNIRHIINIEEKNRILDIYCDEDVD